METVDINPGAVSSFPSFYTDAGNLVLFSASDDVNSKEYWRSDGTTAGTYMLKNINPLGGQIINASDILQLTTGTLIVANDGESCQIWTTDGSTPGTLKITSLDATNQSTSTIEKTIFNNIFYFFLEGDVQEILRYDPFTQQIFPVFNATDAINFRYPFSAENALLFAGTGSLGEELYTIKNDTIYLVKDIYSGPSGGNINLENAIAYKNGALVVASSIDEGSELWFTDGTSDGTHLVNDIYDGPTSSSIDTKKFILLNDKYFFKAYDESLGNEIWVVEGNPAVASNVIDLYPGVNGSPTSDLFLSNNQIYFKANNGVVENALFKTDGTSRGTQLVYDFEANGQYFEYILLATEDEIFMSFSDDNTGFYNIWKTDTRTDQTLPITSFSSSSFEPLDALASDKSIFFRCYSPTVNSDKLLLMIDRATNQQDTMSIMEFSFNQYSNPPIIVDSAVYFSATTLDAGEELWRSEGTVAGTFMVKDIAEGSKSSYLNDFVYYDGLVYFTANDQNNIERIWQTDGVENNTVLAVDPNFDISTISPEFKILGSDLFFEASTLQFGKELYRIPKSCCLEEMDVKFIPTPNGIYEASALLRANGVIPAGGSVTLKSGAETILGNGFEIENGLFSFEIQLENCQN